MTLKSKDFSYFLPEDLIAQIPSSQRDESRLLLCQSWDRKITDEMFSNIPEILHKLYDEHLPKLMIVNNSRVYPARVRIQRQTGARGEVFFLNNAQDEVFSVLLRPLSKLKKGEVLFSDEDNKIPLFIVENLDPPRVTLVNKEKSLKDTLSEYGEMPLPPYIIRDKNKVKINPEMDKERYQTVYSNIHLDGSCAAPTAGLHFTQNIIHECVEKNIHFVNTTLHVGLGTFAPVQTEKIRDHKMHEEIYLIPSVTLKKIDEFLKNNWPIFFVGTTALRSIESFLRLVFPQYSYAEIQECAKKNLFLDRVSQYQEQWQKTKLFIYPTNLTEQILPKIGQGIVTNFHQPESTLCMLVAALMGSDFWEEFYNHAIEKKYRFLSYGDSSLLLFRSKV